MSGVVIRTTLVAAVLVCVAWSLDAGSNAAGRTGPGSEVQRQATSAYVSPRTLHELTALTADVSVYDPQQAEGELPDLAPGQPGRTARWWLAAALSPSQMLFWLFERPPEFCPGIV